MKKLLAILLSALMLCAMIPFATVAAADEPTIELITSVEEVNAGEEFQIEVNLLNLEDTAGLISALVEIGFDTDVFEVVTYFDEDEEMWFPSIEVGEKYNASSNKYIMFGQIYEDTGIMKNCLVKYMRATATANQVRREKHFFTVTLKVKDNAASGTYDLTVIQDDGLFIGNILFDFASVNTSIVVNGTGPVVPPVEECNHEYDSACDVDCNLCYETREVQHNVVAVEAKDATCYENGNIAYWYCDVCGAAWLDAECTQNTNLKAVILPMAHAEATYVAAKAATCTENGNIEYWYCADCGQAWLDEACTLNTNLKAVITPATGHAYDDEFDADCNNCGELRDAACKHEYTYACDAHCALCGELTNPNASHNVIHVEAKAPTCTENGNIEYWYCDICGYAWLNADCVMPINLKAVILPATGHAYDDDFDADCNNCGEIRDASCNHEYESACDPICDKCGETRPVHTDGIVHFDAVEAGCHYIGNIEYWFCPECEIFWADEALTQITNSKNIIVPAKGGNVAHIEAVAPGCHYIGNIEYWVCYECEQFWQDEALTQLTNSKNVILPAIGSENVEHVEAVAPTCLDDGNIEYWHCADCDQYWADEALTQLTNSKNVKLGVIDHNIIHVEAVAPSCYENGNIEYWYCEACGYAWLDEACTLNTNLKAVILPMAHAEATHVAAKDATCIDLGNIEYWYCEACGQAWLDEACTLNTNLKAVILPLGDHIYDSEFDADCNICGAIRDVQAAPGAINFYGNSVTEEVGGLAFLFEIAAENVGIKWWNYYVKGSATVNYAGSEYKLVTMGAIMNNQGDSDLTLDKVDDVYTLNVEAIRLYDLTDDALYYAVRAINMPINHINTIIYARPYMVLEKDGAQIVVYGDVQGQSYNGALNG